MLPLWRRVFWVSNTQKKWQSALELALMRNYAKKAAASGGPALQSQKKKLPVERDPQKLATYCCGSNYRLEGDDVKLGDDKDYPDWLWTLHLGKPKLPSELDRNTEQYWERLHKNALYLKNKLSSSRPKTKLRINEQDKIEKLEAIAHRALAFKHYDPGFSIDKWQRDRFRKFGPLGVYKHGQYISPGREKLLPSALLENINKRIQ